MSMYKCRKCGNGGHLNDCFVGYYDEAGICIFCFKKLTEEEKEEIFKDIDKRKEEWVESKQQ